MAAHSSGHLGDEQFPAPPGEQIQLQLDGRELPSPQVTVTGDLITLGLAAAVTLPDGATLTATVSLE